MSLADEYLPFRLHGVVTYECCIDDIFLIFIITMVWLLMLDIKIKKMVVFYMFLTIIGGAVFVGLKLGNGKTLSRRYGALKLRRYDYSVC